MSVSFKSGSQSAMEQSLAADFVAGATWPISVPAMAALVDMGLSDSRIARYFAVSRDAVATLRTRYGIMRTP